MCHKDIFVFISLWCMSFYELTYSLISLFISSIKLANSQSLFDVYFSQALWLCIMFASKCSQREEGVNELFIECITWRGKAMIIGFRWFQIEHLNIVSCRFCFSWISFHWIDPYHCCWGYLFQRSLCGEITLFGFQKGRWKAVYSHDESTRIL